MTSYDFEKAAKNAVTYNRDKDEVYVDIYQKISNTKIPSSEFNFIV